MSAEAVPEQPSRRQLAHRCTARSKGTGQRCRQPAISEGTTCVYHGGAAPQVRRKADLRLASLVEPAVAQLARELINNTTGTPMSRLRAIENVLDRSGYPRGAVVSDPEQARAQLLDRIRQLAAGRWTGPDHEHHEIIEGDPADPED